MEYNHDEALRIVGVTAMFEGHTYEFRVHNSEGRYMLYMVGHTFPGEAQVKCRHLEEPCTYSERNLKFAIDSSIKEHTRRFHHLKVVE